MPSFFDLQKFAHTGIASPDMTAYDKARALAAFGGGKTQTLTDVPPLSFRANGKPLISWSMLGNGQQTGTPTPDNPVMPTFCGVRTGNLFDYAEYVGTYMANAGLWEYTGTTGTVFRIPCTENTVYTLSLNKTFSLSVYRIATANTDSVPTLYNPIAVTDIVRITSAPDSYSFTTPAGAKYILFQVNASVASEVAAATMLNLGSTALPYEPFGWSEKITCAGQTVPVYLGEVPTVRRVKKYEFTGTEALQTSGSGNARFFYMTIADARSWAAIISDRYVNASVQSTTEEIGAAMSGNSQFRIRPDITSTVEEYKQYLADQYAAGNPVTVWYALNTPETAIVNEPLAKIGDYADELHSEDAGVSIPTAKGQNTLTVDTDLQPSEMTITYKK